MAPLFGMHDTRRFEVFCYSTAPSDGSELRKMVCRVPCRTPLPGVSAKGPCQTSLPKAPAKGPCQ
eukprot:354430-Chlamydomonas_euryale.AAC.1